jgi:hypothetical protein
MAFGKSQPIPNSNVTETPQADGDRFKSDHPNPPTLRLPLRWVLVIPFVLQVSAAVGITAFLSIRNGQRAVNHLSYQLMKSTTEVVHQHLDNYLSTPVEINQISTGLLERGILDDQDLEELGQYFWQQATIHPDLSYIGFTSDRGKYIGAGRRADCRPV